MGYRAPSIHCNVIYWGCLNKHRWCYYSFYECLHGVCHQQYCYAILKRRFHFLWSSLDNNNKAIVHDELAADVTVGTTFDVKSSEQFMMYFFDELTAGMPNTNDVDAKMCATWVSANANNLKIVFEYDGEFSTPTDMCVSATSFTTDALLATGLNSLAGVANGLVVVVGQDIRGAATNSVNTPTTSDDSFNKHFPWGLTATGAAHGMITVTLPLGLDGSKFRMHLQTVNGIQLGLASTGKAGQVYVHRARNNNGRTFEVTQAYENKVAGMTHFSKANAATLPVGTFDADVDPIGSAMGSLTIAAFLVLVTLLNSIQELTTMSILLKIIQ